MPKFAELKSKELKLILATHKLTTSGVKMQMVKRLMEALQTDEISNDELVKLLVAPNENEEETADDIAEVEGSNDKNSETIERNEIEDFERMSISSGAVRKILPTNVTTKFSIKEISETIPTFDLSNTESMSAEHFIDHVESAMHAYGFDDKCLLLAVYSRMKGVARLWLDGQRRLFTTWDEFKNELLEEFGQDLDEAEVNSIMAKTIRRGDEKLIDYCFRIQALGKRYGLSESAIIRHARNGLQNRELQNAIAIVKFGSIREMRKTLLEYESNIIHQPRNVNENRVIKRENKTVQSSTIYNNDKKEVVCYNCNEKGHISKNCTKPQRKKRCDICGRTNHKTENCFQRKNDGHEKRENINIVWDTQNTYNDVVKEAILDGHKVNVFMDTGSSVSLVRSRCLYKFGKIAECKKMLNGFAGGQFIAQKKIIANLSIDNKQLVVELFVVPDSDIPENVLLGRDVLCQKGNEFVIGNNSCQIRLVVSDTDFENNSDEQKAIDELLHANENCFAKDISELGKCTTEKMVIKLTTDIPINLRPYRIPFAKRGIVDNIINDLLTHNIISKTKSAYASPIVLIEKKNGETRFCVDYRSLNKITTKIPFPMPIMEEQFAQLCGNVYFTTLDLRMGYYQVEMHENSKQYTAFVTTDGHYEFNRMPFGLVNAPAVFQQIMNEVVQEMPRGEALAYLDDLIVPSRTVQEGIERVSKLFKILSKHGLKLNPDKCYFLKTEITHLGHIVNKDGIRPGQQKLLAVQNFSVPQNVTEVRRFLGLTGYFRKFVCDYSIIAKPLTLLLHKERIENYNWTTQQQLAFETLIQKLTTAPILVLYDVNQHHQVHTDACIIGLAGMLLQSVDGKSWRPVMYYSRHCTEAEQKYHSYELEVLAVVETLERFRLQLLNKKFTLVTDCASIAHTKTQTELKPRIARWWLRLQEFDFDVIHRPGKRLAHVDAMSRSPVQEPTQMEQAGCIIKIDAEDVDWIVAIQQKDERAKFITAILLKKITSPESTMLRRDYELKDYRLYRKIGNEKKLFVPKAARRELVRHFHEEMGHFGVEKTMQRLTRFFWFPAMRKIVKGHISNCSACCYNKQQRRKSEGELHFDAPIPIPFRVLHLDHLGPFIKSTKGNTYLLVIIDAFSKFTIVKAVRNTKTMPVILALNEVMGYYGMPIRIITDRGTAYTSKMFTEYCAKHCIKHVQTAVRTPRANGQVERMNATLLDMLRTSTEDKKKWDEQLYKFQWIINSQKHSTTRYSPNELIYTFDVKNVVQNHLVAAMQNDEQIVDSENIQQKNENVMNNIANAREKWKTRFDQKHATPTKYNEGDLVVIQYEAPSTGDSRKLEPKYRGPYVVNKVLGKDRYFITNVPGTGKIRQFKSVYSSDRMKPWCYGYPEIHDDEEPDSAEEEEENNEADDVESDDPESDMPRQSRRLLARSSRTVIADKEK